MATTLERPDTCLIGIKQIAAFLGGAHRNTVRNLIISGRFGPTVIKLGGRVLVDCSELERWSAAGCPSREEWKAETANA